MAKEWTTYCLEDFLTSCCLAIKGEEVVEFERWVVKSAQRDFEIEEKLGILKMLCNSSKGTFTFINSITYRLSKEVPPPNCDAYAFTFHRIKGYLSFYYSSDTENWVIKSFHSSKQTEKEMRRKLKMSLFKILG